MASKVSFIGVVVWGGQLCGCTSDGSWWHYDTTAKTWIEGLP